MAQYKWDSPGEWLIEKINSFEMLDFYKLREIALIMARELDSDELQDLFQPEMDDDGYFTEVGVCKHCGASGLVGQECDNCEPQDDLGPMIFQPKEVQS
jgi:hypothetical protein